MLRCRGSLPKSVVLRLSEIAQNHKEMVVSCEQALEQQRRFFYILDSYLHQYQGFAPFGDGSVRGAFSEYLQEYEVAGLRFEYWVIMPNHLHLLTEPLSCGSIECFKGALKQFKLRTTHMLNQALSRRGSLWQAYWYDRWVRNEVEYRRWRVYFRQNPIKAGLCHRAEDWIGLQVGDLL
jgi:putative transposase